MSLFWERFVYLCSLKGMKPNPVAERVGKSSGAVTKWKNGSIPDSNTLIALSDFFGCSIDYLLGRDKGTFNNPPSKKDYMYAFFHGEEGVTDEMMDELEQYASMIKLREENKKKK